MSRQRDDSLAAVPAWILYADKAGLSHGAVRLYGVLASYANGNGKAWPSRRTLARRIGVAKTETVDRLLRELEQAGALQIESGRRRGRANRYLVVTSTADGARPRRGRVPRRAGYPAKGGTP